jgi:hypothetical protein
MRHLDDLFINVVVVLEILQLDGNPCLDHRILRERERGERERRE